MHSLVLFCHITAAALLVGSSLLISPALRQVVRRVRTVAELRACLAVGRPVGLAALPVSLVLLASGIWLASVDRFWLLPWVQLGALFWAVNATAALGFQKPAIGRLAAAAFSSGDGPIDEMIDALRRSRRWHVAANVMLANDVALVFVMTTKPGLTVALLAFVLSHGVVQMGGWLLAARRASPSVPALAPQA